MEMKIAAVVALLSICTLLLVCSDGAATAEQVVHKKVFYSRAFELGPGQVSNTVENIDMPTGHVALRGFEAEVVDENDVSVPLTDVYLHHWAVVQYYVKEEYKELLSPVPISLPKNEFPMRLSAEQMHFHPLAEPEQATKKQGTCWDVDNFDFVAVGAETRHTNMTYPAPYGIVIGDPATIPEGKVEGWYLNVHGISTKDTVDIMSCIECLCESYGVTVDAKGEPLKEGYAGGIHCCYHNTQCAIKENAEPVKRKYFLKYTVTWVDWDTSVIPMRVYGIDVTDERTSLTEEVQCKIEYTVEECDKASNPQCIDHRHTVAALPVSGDVVYARLHQHAASLGGILYDNDGKVICKSDPIYGQGTAAGDEVGFVVGVTTCTPEVGTMYVEAWKELHFDHYYSSEKRHTGVMATFAVRVADPVGYIAEVI